MLQVAVSTSSIYIMAIAHPLRTIYTILLLARAPLPSGLLSKTSELSLTRPIGHSWVIRH